MATKSSTIGSSPFDDRCGWVGDGWVGWSRLRWAGTEELTGEWRYRAKQGLGLRALWGRRILRDRFDDRAPPSLATPVLWVRSEGYDPGIHSWSGHTVDPLAGRWRRVPSRVPVDAVRFASAENVRQRLPDEPELRQRFLDTTTPDKADDGED